jgi:hypothetical protein
LNITAQALSSFEAIRQEYVDGGDWNKTELAVKMLVLEIMLEAGLGEKLA